MSETNPAINRELRDLRVKWSAAEQECERLKQLNAELLQALDRIVNPIPSVVRWRFQLAADPNYLKEIARAAIRKARGEA